MTNSATADVLRRRIALYRNYLREGVSANLAKQYLKEIAAAEAALAKLTEDQKNSTDDPSGE